MDNRWLVTAPGFNSEVHTVDDPAGGRVITWVSNPLIEIFVGQKLLPLGQWITLSYGVFNVKNLDPEKEKETTEYFEANLPRLREMIAEEVAKRNTPRKGKKRRRGWRKG